MQEIPYFQFIQTLPEFVIPQLPPLLQSIQSRQPFRWIIQFHFGEPRLHYEVSRAPRRKDLELAYHFEAKDQALNRHLLLGFRRHLFEIRDTLGETIEAEMWDKGWSKIYEVFPEAPLTRSYQKQVAQRMAQIIACLQPIYADLRADITRIHR